MRQVLFILTLFISIKSHTQIGIGTNTPDASAKLDITSSNKGFLPPRISLTASNIASPITSPATGLLVYNTATAGNTINWYADSLRTGSPLSSGSVLSKICLNSLNLYWSSRIFIPFKYIFISAFWC